MQKKNIQAVSTVNTTKYQIKFDTDCPNYNFSFIVL